MFIRKHQKPLIIVAVLTVLSYQLFFYKSIIINYNSYVKGYQPYNNGFTPAKQSKMFHYGANASNFQFSVESKMLVNAELMKKTPNDIMKIPSIYSKFNPNSKNPCFHVSQVQNLHCLPYFLVIGFPKSATSDLWYRMTNYPTIFGALRKEPHFWDMWTNMKKLGYYTKMYADATHRINLYWKQTNYSKCPFILGDFTPSTIWSMANWKKEPLNYGQPEPKILTAHRIKHLLPKTKLIVMLRDPVERLFSSYKYFRTVQHNLKTDADHFHVYVTEAIAWWEDCTKIYSERLCAISVPSGIELPPELQKNDGYMPLRFRNSLYYVFISEWLSVFPRNQMLFLKFEDYVVNPSHVIEQEIFQFLDVELTLKINITNNDALNKNYEVSFDMHKETRDILKNFFEPYNKKLASLINNGEDLWAD